MSDPTEFLSERYVITVFFGLSSELWKRDVTRNRPFVYKLENVSDTARGEPAYIIIIL